MKISYTLIVALALVACAAADVYMQNPRGSNNRCRENNQNRQNANRLFNSQNNNAGGYGQAPQLSYYEGSWLTIEWTSQHACGNDNTNCQMVLQYMCGMADAVDGENIRDGTQTNRIPENPTEAHEKDGTTYRYGMHETLPYFKECETRERNKGLFIADRNLNGDNAERTRQNEGGTEYGFECQEERDYYPYWHPTPWKDIAIFATDTSECGYYKDESQNVMPKGHCTAEKEENKEDAWQYNNREACTAGGHTWVEDGAWGIAKPECLKAPWSRDNHLGNAITDTLAGHMAHYNWSLPTSSVEPCIEQDNCACVLRLRYNISTAEYEGRPFKANFVDARFNSEKEEDALILQDQYVMTAGVMLSLALNTNQFGRTFQDRSHVFSIRPRPGWLNFGQRIFNLNVRGRRGNIVQTFPANEYDFVPQFLYALHQDYVHPQWTGVDDFNNGNNDNQAEGTDGTDRHNMVQIASMAHNMPIDDSPEGLRKFGGSLLFEETAVRNLFAFLNQDNCQDYAALKAENGGDNNDLEEDPNNCMKLNAARKHFDGGALRLNTTGSFYYMSTRNNNFSNRSQKGSITVLPILETWAIVVASVGGAVCLGSMALGALALHARKNPMSPMATWFDRI